MIELQTTGDAGHVATALNVESETLLLTLGELTRFERVTRRAWGTTEHHLFGEWVHDDTSSTAHSSSTSSYMPM
jgi:hypothetical protein